MPYLLSLLLNISNIVIGGNGNKEVQGLSIENISTSDITITSMNITWDSGNKITEINSGGVIWSLKKGEASGTEIDIVDQLML